MIPLELPSNLTLGLLAAAGIAVGLGSLARGLAGYRGSGRISGTSVSRIGTMAAGEVLVSGAAEAIELTLVSPLQSVPCIYYRARVTESRDGDGRDVFREERAVGFRVRDASGTVRVFPGAARFDVPNRYDEGADAWGGGPPGLQPRTGSAFGPGPDDRDAQVAALLTVRSEPRRGLLDGGGPPFTTSGRNHYREARIEPGDVVTVIGRVVPFADLADPAAANLLDGSGVDAGDPEVAADLAEARAAGLLESTPEAAWGNAAIEGFGIGRPVRPRELDPAANRPPPADETVATRARAAFTIAPDALVFAGSSEVPLLVSLGAPTQVAAREQWQFVLGLGGAALAIVSAMGLALWIQGGPR